MNCHILPPRGDAGGGEVGGLREGSARRAAHKLKETAIIPMQRLRRGTQSAAQMFGRLSDRTVRRSLGRRGGMVVWQEGNDASQITHCGLDRRIDDRRHSSAFNLGRRGVVGPRLGLRSWLGLGWCWPRPRRRCSRRCRAGRSVLRRLRLRLSGICLQRLWLRLSGLCLQRLRLSRLCLQLSG